jgi:hypothetical protein
VIAALGLAALASSRAPGLRALLAEAGLSRDAAPSSEDVAFRIGPRLNAAGRIDTAHLALSLFESRDPIEAEEIARDLSARNAERQGLERRVVAEARARVEESGGAGDAAVIIEADAGWHRGVLGIAASRLAREYHRPVRLRLEGGRATARPEFGRFAARHPAELATNWSSAARAGGGRDAAADWFEVPRARSVPSARPGGGARPHVRRPKRSCPRRGDGQRRQPRGSSRTENPRPVLLARGVRAAGPLHSRRRCFGVPGTPRGRGARLAAGAGSTVSSPRAVPSTCYRLDDGRGAGCIEIMAAAGRAGFGPAAAAVPAPA